MVSQKLNCNYEKKIEYTILIKPPNPRRMQLIVDLKLTESLYSLTKLLENVKVHLDNIMLKVYCGCVLTHKTSLKNKVHFHKLKLTEALCSLTKLLEKVKVHLDKKKCSRSSFAVCSIKNNIKK